MQWLGTVPRPRKDGKGKQRGGKGWKQKSGRKDKTRDKKREIEAGKRGGERNVWIRLQRQTETQTAKKRERDRETDGHSLDGQLKRDTTRQTSV